MKLGVRIFLCYIFIFGLCFYFPINWVFENLRTRYLEGVEDPLVDQANIMAAIIGLEMENNRFDEEKLYKAFENVYNRDLASRIYRIVKTHVDIRVYITDASGKVIFDSEDKDNIGKDYSQWRDVRLTLRGEYGARTTKNYADDPTSSILYVAAPITVNNTIAGVLTVAKPTVNINSFLQKAKPQFVKIFAIAIVVAILLSFVVAMWLTLPIKRLTHYAMDFGAGKRVDFPKLGGGEIGEMGKAFEQMQEALEGKKYVETYVHTLTHEIKSPISAIRGAAELLEEKMKPEQRKQFLSNIRNEAAHIQDIVDRMLELSALENKKILQKHENISFYSLIKTVLESKQPLLSKKQLSIVNKVQDDIMVHGDSFLLHQAVSNLIQNAMDFSPVHGQIELTSSTEGDMLLFMVMDQGAAIPDFAMEKIFDKFFSLPRPDSGKKSTGLGLNFVKEVAMLHHGEITLEKNKEGGVCARLILPL